MGYSVGMLWIGVFMIAITACHNIYKMQTAYIADVSDYYSVEEGIAERLRTDINITRTNYSTGLLEISAKNTGSTAIKLAKNNEASCTDIILDGVWMRHENITTGMYNVSINPLIWDPTEYAKLLVNVSLSSGVHNLTVVSCYGAKDETAFSI